VGATPPLAGKEGTVPEREYWIAGSIVSPPEADRRSGSRDLCGKGGPCGSLVNRTYYDAHDGTRGFGDCSECGRTVSLPRSERAFESLGRLVDAIIPPPPFALE
jgi:hypothetical protein